MKKPPERCPSCGSRDTAEILYGLPSEEAVERAERGEIEIGGCCVEIGAPTTRCQNCGRGFGAVRLSD